MAAKSNQKMTGIDKEGDAHEETLEFETLDFEEDEDTNDAVTLKEMAEKIFHKREKRSKKRNDLRKEANTEKDQKNSGKNSKQATIADEEDEDDDFVNPPPRESKDKSTTKEKSESQYRCGLQPIYKMIKLVKEKKALNKKQIDLLKSSPFFDFFNVFYEGDIELHECKKRYENLDAVYKCFSANETAFIFGKEKMIVTAEDISLLFGLPMIGNNIEPVTKMTSNTLPTGCRNFASRMFGKSTFMTRILIEKRIKEEVGKKTKKIEEDLPILLILDILCTFFFPNNQQKLRWGLLEYVTDFEKMKTVSWPKTIETNFHKFVKKFIHNPRNMSGCSMLPLYCMCEKMKLIKPRYNVTDTHPRFARWDLKGLKTIVTKEFLDGIVEGEVHEIADIRPHEKRLLENVEEISTRLKTAKVGQQSRKRKREEEQPIFGSFEQEVTVRILNIHIQEIKEENKKLKKELKNERMLRKEAEREISRLKEELKGNKPFSSEAEIPNNDSEGANVEKNVPYKEQEDIEKNDPNIGINDNLNERSSIPFENEESHLHPLSNKSTTKTALLLTPPNFDLKITRVINEIHAQEAEEKKKKTAEIGEPASYVGRLKTKIRKNTRRQSYVYSAEQKPRRNKEKIESEKPQDKQEQNQDIVPKPLAVEEPNWQALGLSHCPCVKYLKLKQQSAVKKHFSISKATGKDVARTDGTVLGGCVITNDMIVHLLEGNSTDGQVIDWFAKNCGLHEHSYLLTTTGTKALVEKFNGIVNTVALPMLKTVVEDKLTEVVYFPLHCDHHWTLVTLTYANMQWSHYDSNRPRRSNENNNSSLKAAMILRTEVEKILQQLWKEQNVQDMKLSNSEIHQLECAQQDPDTLDCGIFVMMFIISLDRKEIPQNVPKKDMLKCRALLAYEICSATGYLWDLADYMSSFHMKEK